MTTYTITGTSGVWAAADSFDAATLACRTFVETDGETAATIRRDNDGAWRGEGRLVDGRYRLTLLHGTTS